MRPHGLVQLLEITGLLKVMGLLQRPVPLATVSALSNRAQILTSRRLTSNLQATRVFPFWPATAWSRPCPACQSQSQFSYQDSRFRYHLRSKLIGSSSCLLADVLRSRNLTSKFECLLLMPTRISKGTDQHPLPAMPSLHNEHCWVCFAFCPVPCCTFKRLEEAVWCIGSLGHALRGSLAHRIIGPVIPLAHRPSSLRSTRLQMIASEAALPLSPPSFCTFHSISKSE